MQYTELDIKLDQIVPFSEIIITKLDQINFEAFQEYDEGVKCYINSEELDKSKIKLILDEISNQINLEYSYTIMPQINWNEEWEKNFQPIEINSKCLIRAEFHKNYDSYEDEIIINPKMSFGTGHHETTYLMINQIYNLELNSKSVLDVGSGTGILSILSSKHGAKKILAIDNDDWAYKNSIENSRLNKIENIEFVKGEIEDIEHKSFDVILANINRNIILNDLSKYYKYLNTNGDLLISGFLESDVNVINECALKNEFSLLNKKNKGKWYMIHLKK